MCSVCFVYRFLLFLGKKARKASVFHVFCVEFLSRMGRYFDIIFLEICKGRDLR